MSKFWKIAGIATLVAVIGAGALGLAVYAQEPEPTTSFGQMSDYLEQMLNAIAAKLGVERAALDSAIDESQREVIEQAVEDGLLTQEQAERAFSRLDESMAFAMPFGRGGRGRFGMAGRGGFGPMGELHDHDEWIADLLGMTVDEVEAELAAGKTIVELAEEKGVDLEAARLEAMKDRIQQAVEEGNLTQEQADWTLEGLEQGFMPGGRGFFGGPGGHFRGFPCPQNIQK